MLYNENLLVRINSSGPVLAPGMFDYRLPILATHDCAKQITNHVMEIVLLRDYLAYGDEWTGIAWAPEVKYSENCFVVAADDLQRFCLVLLMDNQNPDRPLSKLVIAMEISHDIDENDTADDDTKSMSRQMCRLLEPFRSLHSLEAVHIEGPISKADKTAIIARMCRPNPSDEELFDRVLTTYEDAMTTYHTSYPSLAITKLKHTLDTMKECHYLSTTGPFDAPTPPWDACRDLKFNIWYSLAVAYLQNRNSCTDVEEAYYHVEALINTYLNDNWDFSNVSPMGHGVAMVFYQLAEVQNARNDLQTHSSVVGSTHDLRKVVGHLREGLRHEPGNQLLKQALKRKEEEVNNAEEVEDLMEMSDRIHERGEYSPSYRGRGGYRGRGRGRGRY